MLNERSIKEAEEQYNNKILLVEDDVEISTMLKNFLATENFDVVTAFDGQSACDKFFADRFSLVLLDLMIPKMSGIEVMGKIRESDIVPIIILSAKSEDADKILGLNVGADDYVTKPFNPLELVARVKAQLRRYKRYNTGSVQEDVLEISGLTLNIGSHECFLNEKPLNLTPTEFSILRILCQRRGQVVSAEELFHLIWEDEYYTKNNNTITVHIRHLREKMGDSFENPQYIKTVWGCGYKI